MRVFFLGRTKSPHDWCRRTSRCRESGFSGELRPNYGGFRWHHHQRRRQALFFSGLLRKPSSTTRRAPIKTNRRESARDQVTQVSYALSFLVALGPDVSKLDSAIDRLRSWPSSIGTSTSSVEGDLTWPSRIVCWIRMVWSCAWIPIYSTSPRRFLRPFLTYVSLSSSSFASSISFPLTVLSIWKLTRTCLTTLLSFRSRAHKVEYRPLYKSRKSAVWRDSNGMYYFCMSCLFPRRETQLSFRYYLWLYAHLPKTFYPLQTWTTSAYSHRPVWIAN